MIFYPERGSLKTVQFYLGEANRDRLLEAYANRRMSELVFLLEHRDMKIDDLINSIKSRMNAFIDELLEIKATPSSHMVMFLAEAASGDEKLPLGVVDANELMYDIYSVFYALDMVEAEEALGYLVADNKLTQDHMSELLAQFLDEISLLGMNCEDRQKRIDELNNELKASLLEIAEGKVKPAETVIREIAEEHGFPIDEKDEFKDGLKTTVADAEAELNRYSQWRERSRILESFGEKAEPFMT